MYLWNILKWDVSVMFSSTGMKSVSPSTLSTLLTLMHIMYDWTKRRVSSISGSNIIVFISFLEKIYLSLVLYWNTRLPDLNFKFRIKRNVIKYRVKTQNPVNNSIDGTIPVRTEQIYDNMSKAMCALNTSLFNSLHKSYYNEIDME